MPRARLRLSLATMMMFVVAAAAVSALFVKTQVFIPDIGRSYLKVDAPALFVASIALTALALGALKGHTANQMMLQVTLACIGYLSLFELAERRYDRPLLYWFQISFAVLVTGPLLARNAVKTRLPRGPERAWWKNTCEAVFFSFLTMMLVVVGMILQWLTWALSPQLLKF